MGVPRRLTIQVPRQTGNIDSELSGNMVDDARRHLDGIRQECTEKPDGQQLQGETQAVGIAAALADEGAVGIVDMEEPRELDGADFIGVPTVAALLRLGQKIDWHRGVSENERLPRLQIKDRNGGKNGPYLSHLFVSRMKVSFTHGGGTKARQNPD